MILLSRRFAPLARQERRAVERRLVLDLLEEYFGQRIELAHTEEGQPYLPEHPQLYISISHTIGLVLVALSKEPIGLDVELLGERIPHIAPRILSEATARLISQCPSAEQSLLYHFAWTGAEALFKLCSDSQLISDFDYIPTSFVHRVGEEYSYYCQAKCRYGFDLVLQLEAKVSAGYMITKASYASKK